ncbi:MAG: hypothetical protein AAGC99_18910, partial [Pseudomonadota bacterium]
MATQRGLLLASHSNGEGTRHREVQFERAQLSSPLDRWLEPVGKSPGNLLPPRSTVKIRKSSSFFVARSMARLTVPLVTKYQISRTDELSA